MITKAKSICKASSLENGFFVIEEKTRQGEETHISSLAKAEMLSLFTSLVFTSKNPGIAYKSIVETEPSAVKNNMFTPPTVINCDNYVSIVAQMISIFNKKIKKITYQILQ